jgi:hypothetical protein
LINDEDHNFERLILDNSREWNGFWFWRDKPVGERGAARNILEAAGVLVTDLVSLEPGQDPPDCEATLDGKCAGVEVTELVQQRTLDRSIKAVRQRARGEEPQKPEAHFAWDRNDLLAALQKLLDRKNSGKPKRTYERYVLVIHTDEMFLDRESVARFLAGATFSTSLITDAFLGLSYEPASKSCPTFRLQLTPGGVSASDAKSP